MASGPPAPTNLHCSTSSTSIAATLIDSKPVANTTGGTSLTTTSTTTSTSVASTVAMDTTHVSSQYVKQEIRAMCSARLTGPSEAELSTTNSNDSGGLPMDVLESSW